MFETKRPVITCIGARKKTSFRSQPHAIKNIILILHISIANMRAPQAPIYKLIFRNNPISINVYTSSSSSLTIFKLFIYRWDPFFSSYGKVALRLHSHRIESSYKTSMLLYQFQFVQLQQTLSITRYHTRAIHANSFIYLYACV